MAQPTTTIEVKRGETLRFSLAIKSQSTKAAYDLTGFTPSLVVKQTDLDGATVFTLSGGDLTIPTPSNGVVSCIFSSTNTALLTFGEQYFFDLKLESATDTLYTRAVQIKVLKTSHA